MPLRNRRADALRPTGGPQNDRMDTLGRRFAALRRDRPLAWLQVNALFALARVVLGATWLAMRAGVLTEGGTESCVATAEGLADRARCRWARYISRRDQLKADASASLRQDSKERGRGPRG